ncbi:MAG: hypothetical protein U1E52_15705 [Geminicoccaceae bacterium]
MRTALLRGLAFGTCVALALPAVARELRSADTHVDGYPTVEAVKYMGELLSQKTNGELTIQVFHWPSWVRRRTRSSRPSSARST